MANQTDKFSHRPHLRFRPMSDAILGAVAQFAAPRHGVISRKRAAQFGLTPWQVTALVDKGLLDEPFAGVLVFRSSSPSWRQDCSIADAAMAGRGLQSHRGAARLHRLDGCTDRVVEVITHRGRPSLPSGVVEHRVRAWYGEEVEIDGIATTGLARTLADL